MKHMMCDVWCVYESRGDQRYPIWEILDLLRDISKLIPGGSHINTISCKASQGEKKVLSGQKKHLGYMQGIQSAGMMWEYFQMSRRWNLEQSWYNVKGKTHHIG